MKIKILMVCLGNICRSPLAEGIMKSLVIKKNLQQIVEVDSAGTSGHMSGSLPDKRSILVAKENGIELHHRARQITKRDFEIFDHILVMDNSNLKNILSIIGDNDQSKIKLITDFDSRANAPKIVADPYYGDISHFRATHEQLIYCCHGWLKNYF